MMTDRIPSKFAANGNRTAIPSTNASGYINWDQGYTQDYARRIGQDPNAKAVERAQMNWLLGALTENANQWQNQAIPDWRGDAGMIYETDAIVRASNGIFRCIQRSTNNEPVTNTAFWEWVPTLVHIRQISPMPAGGGAPTAEVPTTAQNANSLQNGTWEFTDGTAVSSQNLPVSLGGMLESKSFTDPGLGSRVIQRYTSREGKVFTRAFWNSWLAWVPQYGGTQRPAAVDIGALSRNGDVGTGNYGFLGKITVSGSVAASSTDAGPRFTGTKVGSTYGDGTGVFRAILDNPNGQDSYFFDGMLGGANGTKTFSVRGDGAIVSSGDATFAGRGSFSGGVRSNVLAMRDDCIENWAYDSDAAVVAISYNGFNGGHSRFRNFEVYDGKGNQLFKLTGSTKQADFSGSLNVVGGATFGGLVQSNNAFVARRDNTGNAASDGPYLGLFNAAGNGGMLWQKGTDESAQLFTIRNGKYGWTKAAELGGGETGLESKFYDRIRLPNARLTKNSDDDNVAVTSWAQPRPYLFVTNNDAPKYFKIATLPTSGMGTLDRLLLSGCMGAWVSSAVNFTVNISNRGGVTVLAQSSADAVPVVVVTEADGSATVYAAVVGTFHNVIMNAYTNERAITMHNGEEVAEAALGTIAWDGRNGKNINVHDMIINGSGRFKGTDSFFPQVGLFNEAGDFASAVSFLNSPYLDSAQFGWLIGQGLAGDMVVRRRNNATTGIDTFILNRSTGAATFAGTGEFGGGRLMLDPTVTITTPPSMSITQVKSAAFWSNSGSAGIMSGLRKDENYNSIHVGGNPPSGEFFFNQDGSAAEWLLLGKSGLSAGEVAWNNSRDDMIAKGALIAAFLETDINFYRNLHVTGSGSFGGQLTAATPAAGAAGTEVTTAAWVRNMATFGGALTGGTGYDGGRGYDAASVRAVSTNAFAGVGFRIRNGGASPEGAALVYVAGGAVGAGQFEFTKGPNVDDRAIVNAATPPSDASGHELTTAQWVRSLIHYEVDSTTGISIRIIDGVLEMWGTLPNVGGPGSTTVALPRPYASADYNIQVSGAGMITSVPYVVSQTAATFEVDYSDPAETRKMHWRTIGRAA